LDVSLPAHLVAGLVLAALPHLGQNGLDAPTASEVIVATGASRTSAYKARDQISKALPGILRSPGRPRSEAPDVVTEHSAIHIRVREFLFDHPGCVSGSSLRRTYSESYQLFVLDLAAENLDIDIPTLSTIVGVPLATLKDWQRGGRPQVEPPATLAVESTGPAVAQVEAVLAAWTPWAAKKKGFVAFCTHVQRHLRIAISRHCISDILEAHGVRIPKRRGRDCDAAAMRGRTETFFSGAQWVGDGMELCVDVDGVTYCCNLELDVDMYSGALVGASIRPTEDQQGVVEALQDGIATTGAPPLALLLDNKPSNHCPEVEAALDDTIKLRARPYQPTDKAHVEGVFGLFSQEAPDLVVCTEPSLLAAQVAALVFTTWARAVNHRPRADRKNQSRVGMYANARPTPEEVQRARTRLAERLALQERARQTRKRKEDPVARAALDAAFERLGLPDPDNTLRRAIACWPLDAILAGIAVFEGKAKRGTLPDGVDGGYLRGIVVNLSTEAESMAIADALLTERLRAQDIALNGLERARGWLEERGDDPTWLVKSFTSRAVKASRRLDRMYWLRAAADVVLDAADERKTLLRLAARHISSSHSLSSKDRNAAIRFLFAKAVVVA